jgi:hypothetical protein
MLLIYTALTVREHLDHRPGALRRDWTVSPAHLLGDPSSSGRGCPSAESDTNWTSHRLEPAVLSRPARGHRRVSRAWRLRVPLFPVEHCSAETSTLNRCLVQPQAVTSNRNQVSHKRLAKVIHHLFLGRPPRPRDASVCPLDNGGLIGVRPRPALKRRLANAGKPRPPAYAIVRNASGPSSLATPPYRSSAGARRHTVECGFACPQG